MGVRNRAMVLSLLIGLAVLTAACSSSAKAHSPSTTAAPGRHPGQARPGPPTTVKETPSTTDTGAGGM